VLPETRNQLMVIGCQIPLTNAIRAKLNVLARLRERTGDAPILSIGDRGRWPRNDYELLRGAFALSVDEMSVDPATCWNLAECGQRGVAATLEYLRALEGHRGALRFRQDALQ
jgi:hypothetical protein